MNMHDENKPEDPVVVSAPEDSFVESTERRRLVTFSNQQVEAINAKAKQRGVSFQSIVRQIIDVNLFGTL